MPQTSIHQPPKQNTLLSYAAPDVSRYPRRLALLCAILCTCSTLAVVIAHQLHKPTEPPATLPPDWNGWQIITIRVRAPDSNLVQNASALPIHLLRPFPILR